MKVILSLLVILIISSCGKKSGGSSSGDSPLLPAPAISGQPSLYEKSPLPELQSKGLRIEYPFVICFNAAATNYDKKLALQELLDLIHQNKVSLAHPREDYISMLDTAINTLNNSNIESHLCPKIYLAINKKD